MATTLHLLSRSPFNDGRLGSCLHLLSPGDGIMLTLRRRGVRPAGRTGTQPAKALEQLPASNSLFALQEDLQARGLEAVPARRVGSVDYPGFVELCTRFDKVNSWL